MDVANLQKSLNERLEAIFDEKGVSYSQAEIAMSVKPVFDALASGFKLREAGQSIKYRIGPAISHAAGYAKGDWLAQVKTLSLKAIGSREKLEEALYMPSGIVPQYGTAGLLEPEKSVEQVGNHLDDQLHDHRLEMMVSGAINECLVKPMARALSETLGAELAQSFAEKKGSIVHTMVLAGLLNKRELRDRCASLLQVSPGALLLGRRHDDKKRTIKEGAVCWVLCA